MTYTKGEYCQIDFIYLMKSIVLPRTINLWARWSYIGIELYLVSIFYVVSGNIDQVYIAHDLFSFENINKLKFIQSNLRRGNIWSVPVIQFRFF